MYCKEPLDTEGSDNYWLGRCDIAGGSSEDPWVQPTNEIEPGSLTTDSASQGRTWTAIVNGPDPLSGTFK